MSESMPAECNNSGVGGESITGPRFFKPVVMVILFVLAIAAVTLRFHRLDELPPGLYFDEGANGLDALQVLQGKHSIYFPENFGREPLGIYLMALAVSLLDRTELALRVPSAIASVCTVFAVFWLGWLLYSRDRDSGQATPWRGLLVGGVGAGLLAVSLAQTVVGRTSFRVNFLPLLLTLCLAFLWEGWRLRNRMWVALAGASAGLLAYSYISARLAPILLLLFGLSCLMPWDRGEQGSEIRGKVSIFRFFSNLNSRVKAELPLVSVFVVVSGVMAAPILVYFVLHPNYFFLRLNQISVFQTGSGLFDMLWALVVNVWEHLIAFGIRGDPNWRHNYSGQPLLNKWEALLFWLGVGTAVWRWKQPSYRLLLLWLALLLLPALLSRDEYVPHFLRMFGALPAMYLLTGVGAWVAIRFLRDRTFLGQVKWAPDLRSNGAKAATVAGVVFALILIQGWQTYSAYFQAWAASPEVAMAFETTWTDMAHALNEHPSKEGTVNLIALHSGNEWRHPAGKHPSFEYIYTGAGESRIINSTTTHNLAPKVLGILETQEEVTTVNYMDWSNSNVGGPSYSHLQFSNVLGKYGRYLGSESHEGFQIHRYAELDLSRPWTYYDHLEPLTVNYDGGISLVGFSVGQGAAQLSSHQLFDLAGDRSWWVVLQWITAPGLETVYSISLRLHDSEGRLVSQQDAVLENWEPSTTNRWQPDQPVDSLHFLEFPSELSAGEYELRLVVYDFESHKPTVEIGIWEAETTISRLEIGTPK